MFLRFVLNHSHAKFICTQSVTCQLICTQWISHQFICTQSPSCQFICAQSPSCQLIRSQSLSWQLICTQWISRQLIYRQTRLCQLTCTPSISYSLIYICKMALSSHGHALLKRWLQLHAFSCCELHGCLHFCAWRLLCNPDSCASMPLWGQRSVHKNHMLDRMGGMQIPIWNMWYPNEKKTTLDQTARGQMYKFVRDHGPKAKQLQSVHGMDRRASTSSRWEAWRVLQR